MVFKYLLNAFVGDRGQTGFFCLFTLRDLNSFP